MFPKEYREVTHCQNNQHPANLVIAIIDQAAYGSEMPQLRVNLVVDLALFPSNSVGWVSMLSSAWSSSPPSPSPFPFSTFSSVYDQPQFYLQVLGSRIPLVLLSVLVFSILSKTDAPTCHHARRCSPSQISAPLFGECNIQEYAFGIVPDLVRFLGSDACLRQDTPPRLSLSKFFDWSIFTLPDCSACTSAQRTYFSHVVLSNTILTSPQPPRTALYKPSYRKP
ncbi:hypothetical protein FRC02_003052 [Tulasnella sp. 418]|nr:hypothetical protein FRC02_003052 [Tulasnella sp. 418]